MPKTLLLADDSVTIQKVVGITFANEDVELVTVDNGDDALVRARQIKPDLVLADIGMPGLDGYALCGAIRKDPTIAHTPVLLLTGTFETYDEDKAREVGANGYISKPFEAQALVDRVQAMLAQKVAPPPRAVPPTRPITVPVPPAAAPVAPAATTAPQRPKLELPPLPGATISGAKPVRPAKPRVASPFEFDVTPEPAPAAAAPKVTPAPAPLWEAEPELEMSDETPLRKSEFAAQHIGSDADDEAKTTPDSTRLFAPDLLGRPGKLPVVEPPSAAKPARPDFSFGDLDFEEPTGPAGNQTQIFGESSGPLGAETVLANMPAAKPAHAAPPSWDEREPNAPLADPLYAKTRFVDPHASHSAPSFDTPLPALAPPLPDLLAHDEDTAPSQSLSEIELSEPEPEIEAERVDDADPLAEPFSPDTSAAFEEPEFAPVARAKSAAPPSLAATRLAFANAPVDDSADDLELEPDLVDAEALPDEGEPPAELDDWNKIRTPAAPELRPTAPLPSRSLPVSAPASVARTATGTAMIDSTLLAQTLEKVAWEAFGSLSEQVVNEVRKRVEAVVWEVVPQMCERLIREEIARLKAELPE